jgi:hypothetical protein
MDVPPPRCLPWAVRWSYSAVVTWDATGLWVLLVIGCGIGVIAATRSRLRVAGRPRLRDAPLPFVGICIEALVTGLGCGMAAVFIIVLVADAMRAFGL